MMDQSHATPADFFEMFTRNLEPDAFFAVEHNIVRRSANETQADPSVHLGESSWYPLTESGLLPLLNKHAFVINEVRDEHVAVSIVETSFACYGYAAPIRRRGRDKRKKKAIRESVEDLKSMIAAERAMLKHFVSLSDAYKRDPQLSSTEAKTSMEVLLSGLYSRNPEQAAMFGQVEFEPNQMAWIQLFDQIGSQTLGEFLGINSMADIPGGDLDARADEIRQQAGADTPPAETAPEAMVASKPSKPSSLCERLQKQNLSVNPMSRYFWKQKQRG